MRTFTSYELQCKQDGFRVSVGERCESNSTLLLGLNDGCGLGSGSAAMAFIPWGADARRLISGRQMSLVCLWVCSG